MNALGAITQGRVGRLRLARQAPSVLATAPSSRLRSAECSTRGACVLAKAEEGDTDPVQYNQQFGYSRKDVILIGVGLIAFGYAVYYGLQATGMEAGMAGNFTQLFIFVGLCIGWIGSYVFRVANKDMTYVKQLKEYEEAVMKKRLEELNDTEVERLMGEVEDERKSKK
eukprot:jgi/Ulvmu1/1455/UM011_0185.1